MTTMKSSKKSKEELSDPFEDALESLKSGNTLEGKDGVIPPLLRRLLEASMEGEMDAHLDSSRPNRRNGTGNKKVKTSFGEVPFRG
jgi:putative transposase